MKKELKDKLFFIRRVLLVEKGLLEKKIVPFDDSFYNNHRSYNIYNSEYKA